MAEQETSAGFPVKWAGGKKFVVVSLSPAGDAEPEKAQNKEYLLRCFDLPKNLEECADLIAAFKKRFFRNADRGQSTLDASRLDDYIDDKRKRYEAATGDEQELEGGMLYTALIRRACDHVK